MDADHDQDITTTSAPPRSPATHLDRLLIAGRAATGSPGWCGGHPPGPAPSAVWARSRLVGLVEERHAGSLLKRLVKRQYDLLRREIAGSARTVHVRGVCRRDRCGPCGNPKHEPQPGMDRPAPALRYPARRRNALPPLVLDRYRLHRRLGTGPWHRLDGPGRASGARCRRQDHAPRADPSGRFEREARAAARLSHPGIVTLYEAAVDDEGAYLVSELVRGPSLTICSAGQLSDRDIVSIGIALCRRARARPCPRRRAPRRQAFKRARARPPLDPGRIAKLTDFGVARVIGATR